MSRCQELLFDNEIILPDVTDLEITAEITATGGNDVTATLLLKNVSPNTIENIDILQSESSKDSRVTCLVKPAHVDKLQTNKICSIVCKMVIFKKSEVIPCLNISYWIGQDSESFQLLFPIELSSKIRSFKRDITIHMTPYLKNKLQDQLTSLKIKKTKKRISLCDCSGGPPCIKCICKDIDIKNRYHGKQYVFDYKDVTSEEIFGEEIIKSFNFINNNNNHITNNNTNNEYNDNHQINYNQQDHSHTEGRNNKKFNFTSQTTNGDQVFNFKDN